MAKCSVVVPVFNRASLTQQCIEKLLADPSPVDREIVVVDDASRDATPRLLESYSDSIRVVRREANGGFAAACNDGAAVASGDYLLFLNNDTLPRPGWLDSLVGYADRTLQAAVVGAKLLHPDGTIQHAGIVITQERIPRHIYAGFPGNHPATQKSRPFRCVTAAAAVVRASAFEQAGGFDTAFRNAYEDIDLCLRLGELGHEVHYCHESVLYHLEMATRDFADYAYNHDLYLSRWAGRVEPDDLTYYLEDGLLELTYWEHFPIKIAASPEFASLQHEGEGAEETLLMRRARQVFELLRENTRLRKELFELSPQRDAGSSVLLKEPESPPESEIPEQKLVFPRAGRPLVSIVIPAHNQWAFTHRCLASILEQAEDDRYEVIVADDASSDETRRLEDFTENVAVVRSSNPRGFLRNCNHAAKRSRGDFIVFLNNDTELTRGWLRALLNLFERDPAVAVAGPKLVYPSGLLQEAGGIIWRDGTGMNYGRGDRPDLAEYQYLREVDYVSGACLIVRRSLWDEVGGFDERFAPAYYEDADLAFEARRRGLKVAYQPASVVVHIEGASHGRDLTSGVKSHQARNQEVFVEKWRDVLQADHYESGGSLFLARERKPERKTLLVIDHYVPHYDEDAGSRATYQYLKLFVELGYRVVFVGDDFAFHDRYTPELQQLGIFVVYGQWYCDHTGTWLRQIGRHLDYVQVHRPHIAYRYLDLLRDVAPQARIAYLATDLHFLRELRRYRELREPDALQRVGEWRSLELELFQRADRIQVYSSYERDLLAEVLPYKLIRRIPLHIADGAVERANAPFEDRSGLLFVAGFGHPPNVDAAVWFVREVLPLVRERLAGVEVALVGSRPPEQVRELAGDGVVVTGRISDKELGRRYGSARVVVAPLRYGAGLKGKIVEAMSFGVPVVTTPLGAEGLDDIEEHLRIASGARAFADAVVETYADRELWSRIAASSREYVMRYFSREAAVEQITSDFPL